MKYLIFGGERYYPAGGVNDMLAAADNPEILLEVAYNCEVEWFHVVETQNYSIVLRSTARPHGRR